MGLVVLITPVDTVDKSLGPRNRTDYACAQHVIGRDTECHAPVDNFLREINRPQPTAWLSAVNCSSPLNDPQVYPHLWLLDLRLVYPSR